MSSRRARARALLGAITRALSLVLLFVLALALGVALHLDLPRARRAAIAFVNPLLASPLQGRIEIDRIAHLGLGGASGIDARLVDDDGVVVVLARGIGARISLVTLAGSMARGEGIHAVLDDVVLASAEVNLDARADGRMRLEAFRPRPSSASVPARPSTPVRVEIRDVEAGHLVARGAPPGLVPLDLEIARTHARLSIAPDARSLVVDRAEVVSRGLPRGANPAGHVRGRLTLPTEHAPRLGVDATFRGAVGGVPAAVDVVLAGSDLAALVHLPPVPAGMLRALVPEAPFDGTVGAQVAVTGTLPRLHTHAHVALGGGSAEVQGTVIVSGRPTGTLLARASALDDHSLSIGAPPFRVSASTLVSFAVLPDLAVRGLFDLGLAGGVVSGNLVPPARIHGDYHVDRARSATVHASGRVDEAGAPTDVVIAVLPDVRSHVVDVEARTKVPRLDATRAGPVVAGTADVRARARLALRDRSLEATVDADATGVVAGAAHIARGHASARVSGPLADPDVEARIMADGVALGPARFATGGVVARGRLDALDVSILLDGGDVTRGRTIREPHLEGRATVRARGAPGVTRATASATRDDVRVNFRARSIQLASGEILVDDAVLEGAGDPLQISFRGGRGGLHARARSTGVDLARLGYVLALDALDRGRLAVDADIALTDRAARGKVVLDLAHAWVGPARDASAHLDATFADRGVLLHARAEEALLGHVEIAEAALALPGTGPIAARDLRGLLGNGRIKGRIDLQRLATLTPQALAPGVAGVVRVDATFARRTPADTPAIDLSARTEGLALGSAVAWPGVDVDLLARVADRTFSVDARVVDLAGSLVMLTARTTALPAIERLAGDDRLAVLASTPFSAKVVAPRRRLATIPLVPPGTSGEVDATLHVSGTANAPVVRVDAHGVGLRGQEVLANPVDVDLEARYEAGVTDGIAKARAPRFEVLRAQARLRANVTDLIRKGASAPWDADVRAAFERFPLGAVAALADHEVHGRVSGGFVVEGLHKDARATFDLRTERLAIGETRIAACRLQGASSGATAHGTLHVEHADGAADASADLGLAWGADLVPRIDRARPGTFTFKARRFPASVVAPFAAPALGDLDGKVDADLRIVARPGAAPQPDGFVALSEGSLELNALGERFDHVRGRVTMTPAGVIRLAELSAASATGLVTATGEARIDGRRLLGAEASIKIPSSRPLPLVSQGVQLGDVFGDVAITAGPSPDGRETNVTVDIPSLHARLTPTTPHAVQSLDDAENIRVGVLSRGPAGEPPRMRAIALDDRPPDRPASAVPPSLGMNVAIRLGSDVIVERGKSLKVQLAGTPRIRVTDRPRASGQIELLRGAIDVSDRRFQIDRGVVTFVDDPANPVVVLTASWTAPDGTRVFVDFKGPLQTGGITLRSEPARSQDELFQLVVFGAVAGSSATPYGEEKSNNRARAGAAASGLATAGLNKGIERLTGLDVSTKVDTSSGPNPRPEVELRIARDVSVQLAFVLGTPPPGTNPDRTYATIDWRFMGSWSLATTFGDQGTSIADVVWRHRY